MTELQLLQIASRWRRSEWQRLGISGSAEAQDDEVSREADRLRRAIGILEAAGCKISVP
jgi:hypothetical protein